MEATWTACGPRGGAEAVADLVGEAARRATATRIRRLAKLLDEGVTSSADLAPCHPVAALIEPSPVPPQVEPKATVWS